MANELVGQCWLVEWPTHTMQIVFMKLCDCAEPDGTSVYPSVATIARETSLTESAVRAQLAALKDLGLVLNRDEKFGNRAGRSTVLREIDIDRLRLITNTRRRGAPALLSSHVIVASASDGQKWEIMPRPAPGSTPPPDGGVPLQDMDPTPPPDGGVPHQDMEGTPPPGGANPFTTPSLDPSLDPPPHPPAKRGERGRGRKVSEVEVALADVAAELTGDTAALAVLDGLIAPIVRQRKLDAPSIAGTLRSLSAWAARKGLGKDECGAIVERLLAARKASVKASDIEAEIKSQLGRRPLPAALDGDAALVPLWPAAMDVLRGMVGPEQFASWCTTLVPVAFDGRLFRVASHERFIATHVERTFAAPLRVAVQSQWPDATAVDVVARPRRAA